MAKHGFSRREFMRSSAGAGIVLAVLPFLLNPEEAAATPPPTGGRVRFGMIGIGMEGSGMLDTSGC